MLQKIRDRIGGWVAGVLFGFLALAFAVWGIQYEFSPRGYAAKVNGEELPLQQVQQSYQAQLNQIQQYYGGDLPEAMLAQLRDNVLESEIREALLRQRADELGYRIGNEALIESIQQIPQFQVGGEFSEQTYRGFLAGRALTPRAFEEDQRALLRRTQLQNAIATTAFTTDLELERYVALDKETREISYLQVPMARYLDPAAVDESAISAYYEEHKEEFKTAEAVSLQYLELRRSDIAEQVVVDEAALRRYYEDVAASRYTVEEERQVSHILVAAQGDSDDEARAEAEQLQARIDAGEDFAKLAREHSDDPGSAAQGGQLDWAGRGVYVGPFEEAVFAMQPGEIRGPVETRFGFHIIRLDDIRSGSTRGFDEVRPELEAEYREQQADDLFRDRAEQLADEAFASFTELDSVAEQLGLELQTVEEFTRAGGDPLGANPSVIEAAFSPDVLEERRNSPLIEVADGDVVVLRVTDHRLPEQRPLEAVRGQIRTLLAERAARQAAREAGEQIVAAARAGGDLGELAAAGDYELRGPQSVSRDSTELPPSLLGDVFRAPVPADGEAAVTGIALPSGDYVVYRLSDIKPGDLRAMPGNERATLRRQLAAQNGGGQFNAYVEELRRGADVQKPAGVFEQIEY